jgi:hypothetical protein
VRHREHDQRNAPGGQEEQRQPGHIRRTVHAESRRQDGQRARGEKEAGQNERDLKSNPLPDVAMDVVRELIRAATSGG